MLPIITATFSPIFAPIALKWSPIWTTSYLAGAKINPKKGVGLYLIQMYLSSNPCKIGSANARVLPLPVSAKAITSWPYRVYGKDYCWILVGLLYPKLSQAKSNYSQMFRSLKFYIWGFAGFYYSFSINNFFIINYNQK